MLNINPKMLSRLDEIEDDLLARRARAEHEAWLGEVEGIDLTLTVLRQKRDETQRLARITRVNLGIPSVQSPRRDENGDMYCLRAVIATEQVLSELAGVIEDAHDAHIVFLGQHLSLLPTTDALFDAVTVAGASLPDGLWNVPAALDRMLAACSANGPVAYVEAEFFGGTGEQHAQVWDNGAVVLGPLHLGENEPIPPTGTPISQALRRLGVTKGNHYDEFDAAGLGRHRDTEDWLLPTS